MNFSGIIILTTLAVVASALPTCKPLAYTLPKIGAGAELTPPAANLVLKKIAIGHGIQNYSCAANSGDSTATGALAVLHDVTSFYPGAERTGIPQKTWDGLPSDLLWNTPYPLNKLEGTEYDADPAKPFPDPTDLRLRGIPPAKFLGHHYFDINDTPVFDLSSADLTATLKKVDTKTAPATADKGIIGTGAVAWLQLDDNGTGQSKGVSSVYRVITAGGAPQSCSTVGVGVQSVPYTTYYWFFG